MEKEIVKFWKGSESAYRELYKRGRIKDNVRYIVTQNDGLIKEYLGKSPINNGDLEQLAYVDDIVKLEVFQEKLKEGAYTNCRLLVGDNNAFDEDGKLKDLYTPSESESSLWYVVVFGEDSSEPTNIIDFSDRTTRVKTYGMMEYQVVDNMLTTYNHIFWNE